MGKEFFRNGEEKEAVDAFRKVVAQAIEWYMENCNPHQSIIISDGMARLVSDEIGLPFKTEE